MVSVDFFTVRTIRFQVLYVFLVLVQEFGIQEVLGSARSPWQRAYVERVIGSIRPRVPGSRDRP
jgi:hypothetical protein